MFVKKEWFKQNGIDKLSLILLNIGCAVSLIIVIFPLLLVAKFDYPSADDWSYGVNGYKALKDGGGFFHVLYAAIQRAKEAYLGWDGRFANDFIDSLQPGIWGEKYYSLTPWILISMLIISEMVFFRFVICFGDKSRNNNWLWMPIVIPVLIIQILYTPSPVESFYWYTGAMNYSFMYGLSLILMVLFMKLGVQEFCTKQRRVLLSILACILSVFVGGGNFSTSLSAVLAACMITVLFLFYKKYSFLRRTWFIVLTTAACLTICLVSPGSAKGNAARMTEMGNPLYAVWRSLVVSANNVRTWVLVGGVLLMLLFIFPFIWRAVENIEISFRYPLLFSLLSFGIYASQAMPDIYVSGYLGGWRQIVILYYGCIILIVGNIFYWTGWLRRIRKVGRRTSAKRMHGSALLLVYCGVIGIALVSFIFVFDKKSISSYKAYRDWRQGLAQQYADEWENRLEILHDDNMKKVEFMPLQYYPDVLLYVELQEDDNNIAYWINRACAAYYDKEYVHMIKRDEEK